MCSSDLIIEKEAREPSRPLRKRGASSSITEGFIVAGQTLTHPVFFVFLRALRILDLFIFKNFLDSVLLKKKRESRAGRCVNVALLLR